MKNQNENYSNNQESMNLSNKEKEILDSYLDGEYEIQEEVVDEDREPEIEEYSIVEDEIPTIEETQEDFNHDMELSQTKGKKKKEKKKKEKNKKKESENIDEFDEDNTKTKKYNKYLNIIFIVLIIIIAMITTDIIAVKKFEKGPFFAIPLHTYKDGGSKAYYGLGYKVIKYNQLQGRRDMVIGTWALKYNSDTIEAEAIDLAIEFTENEKDSYEKYYKQFMKISGVLSNVSLNENAITISYVDEDGKYSLDIVCKMATEVEKLKDLETNIRVTAIGTVSEYEYKSPDRPATLYLDGCFAEQ